MSGSKAEAGVKGDQAVVGAGRTGFGGDSYGGSGGGIDGGGGGDRRDGDGYEEGVNMWEDNVANVTLGVEPNAPLAYALLLELHHPIVSTLGKHLGRLDRERERERERVSVYCSIAIYF